MRLLHCSAGLALLALVLAGCDSATSTCDPSVSPGTCQTLQCTGTLRDCKNGAADGCETDTARDAENCGACGTRCPTPANGEAVCIDGVCGVATCGTRYKDCNTSATDGCEVDTFRDVNNCGACGNVCNGGTNASAVCIAGTCKLACQAAYLDCNGDATDGCETNGASDNDNCGNCGNLCTAMGATNATCAAGSCISTMCTGTFQTCKPGPITSCETDTAISVNNCGTCGKQCGALPNATPGCAASNCGIGSCTTGYGDCDNAVANGCETNTTNSVSHCSACGKACPAPANATAGCAASTCGIGSCNTGYGNCDNAAANGCETSLTNDAMNCGMCGKICGALANASPGCAASACGIGSCNTGYGNCDNAVANGCETNTTTSAANCGACGNNCGALPNAVAGCTASKCAIASCTTGFGDCDKVATNGCETSLVTDSKNCGACGNVCGAGKVCIRSVCAVPSRVLLVHASSYISDVQTKLLASGSFTTVDLFAAGSGTPTLAQLQAYDSVMAFSDGGFSDPVSLGNVLADYFDGGGRVVIAVFGNASVPVRGRWDTGGYHLVNPTGQEQPTDTGALQKIVPTSPLLVGVNTLTATAAYRSTGLEINGGTVIARWGSGAPLVVAGTKGGKNLVSLNFYPPSATIRADFWVGDGVALMKNALIY